MKQIKLVKKAIKVDEEAFETLVVQQSDKLYRTAFLYVPNKEDALDVLQETIYKAFISIDQLKHPEYFSTWCKVMERIISLNVVEQVTKE